MCLTFISVLNVFRGDFRLCMVIPSLLGSPFNVYFGEGLTIIQSTVYTSLFTAI